MTLPEPPASAPNFQQLSPLPSMHPVGAKSAGRGWRLVTIAALVTAIGAAGVSTVALTHRAFQSPAPISSPTPQRPSPNEVVAATQEACGAWEKASQAMVAARKAFVDSPPSWDDPVTVQSLAQAEAGVVMQIEYLRQHILPATPPEIARPIADYIAAAIDAVAADGQHAPAETANAAADRSAIAGSKIRHACGS